MNIGFDAKRAFHNKTGLGFFSRVLIHLMAEHFPQHQYFLFNPKQGNKFQFDEANVHEVLPGKLSHKVFSAFWRSIWVIKDFSKYKIDLYHGLSHEIPVGMKNTGVPSIVTIHDLFPEIYPHQYEPIAVQIYRRKLRHACKTASKIMAISEETKHHIESLYKIAPEKIDVVYQSCNPVFNQHLEDDEKEIVRNKYELPHEFFLHVGTIIQRKNLLGICKAMLEMKNDMRVPLVVIGNDGGYKAMVKKFIKENDLENDVIFLSEKLQRAGKVPFIETADMAAIYQLSTAMIYPSFYEGFGMPIIEAMAGGVPVITSNTSCMPEIGGDAAYYINPLNAGDIADGCRRIYKDALYANNMRRLGLENAQRFTAENYVDAIIKMYLSVLK